MLFLHWDTFSVKPRCFSQYFILSLLTLIHCYTLCMPSWKGQFVRHAAMKIVLKMQIAANYVAATSRAM